MDDIHIGHLIRQTMKEQGRTVTWFADQLCCHRVNVYDIFRRSNIDLMLLMRISKILDHNFLQDLVEEDANADIVNDENKDVEEM